MVPDLSGLARRIDCRSAAQLRAEPVGRGSSWCNRWPRRSAESSVGGTSGRSRSRFSEPLIPMRWLRSSTATAASTLAPARPVESSISVLPDAPSAYVSSRVTMIAIKAYQERWTAPYLAAVQSAQSAPLLPKASPALGRWCRLSRFRPGRPNLAMVESFLADPGMEPLQGSGACRHSAVRSGPPGLALPLPFGRSGRWPNSPYACRSGRLYPEPHSPTLRFRQGLRRRRLDRRLRGESSVLRDADDSAPVVAHMDWSARNVRIGPHGAWWPPTTGTALRWCPRARRSARPRRRGPSPANPAVPSFLRSKASPSSCFATKRRRGVTFDEVQWRAAGAAAAYVLAYTARCEDSLEVGGPGTCGPTRRARPAGRCRRRPSGLRPALNWRRGHNGAECAASFPGSPGVPDRRRRSLGIAVGVANQPGQTPRNGSPARSPPPSEPARSG